MMVSVTLASMLSQNASAVSRVIMDFALSIQQLDITPCTYSILQSSSDALVALASNPCQNQGTSQAICGKGRTDISPNPNDAPAKIGGTASVQRSNFLGRTGYITSSFQLFCWTCMAILLHPRLWIRLEHRLGRSCCTGAQNIACQTLCSMNAGYIAASDQAASHILSVLEDSITV